MAVAAVPGRTRPPTWAVAVAAGRVAGEPKARVYVLLRFSLLHVVVYMCTCGQLFVSVCDATCHKWEQSSGAGMCWRRPAEHAMRYQQQGVDRKGGQWPDESGWGRGPLKVWV